MSDDMKARLDAQLAEVQKEFDANASRIKKMAEQRAVLDKQLSVLQARQSELRGEFAGLKKLIQEPIKDIPIEEPAQVKKTTKKGKK